MLHVETRGRGEDLVMVHGWGMHSGIWSDWADSLARHFRVHLIDLPGHGLSGDVTPGSLDEWARAVMQAAPANAWWLGWSLGGLVTINIARLFADRMRGLVLLASTPKFVAAEDWCCAVDSEIFGQFAAQLEQDVERTLIRFLSLQVRGADNSGEALKKLRLQLKTRPRARARGLSDGLGLLRCGDVRDTLGELEMPVHWLLGARDTLVPAALAGQVGGEPVIIEGAGHAPFLSHPRQCEAALVGWLLAGNEDAVHANH